MVLCRQYLGSVDLARVAGWFLCALIAHFVVYIPVLLVFTCITRKERLGELFRGSGSHRTAPHLIYLSFSVSSLAAVWVSLCTLTILRWNAVQMRPEDQADTWSLGQQLALAGTVLVILRVVNVAKKRSFFKRMDYDSTQST